MSVLLASTALGFAMPAFAQDAADAEEALPGDIVVTATKREESLQKVPLSIQALGEETLDQQQVASLDDFSKLLPSVSFQSFGPGSVANLLPWRFQRRRRSAHRADRQQPAFISTKYRSQPLQGRLICMSMISPGLKPCLVRKARCSAQARFRVRCA